MEIRLDYGKGAVTIDLPSDINVDVYAPAELDSEIDYARFVEIVGKSDRVEVFSGGPVLFVVNDGYRRTPTPAILDWIDRLFPEIIDNSSFLISTGSHGAPTEEHLQKIFGSLLERVRSRTTHHAASDLKSMREVGTEETGEVVYLNKQLFDFDKICIIGSVEPHYFAGFTGGRKSIFPGLTNLATIERNHNLANSLEAMPLRLAGNPVAEHLLALMPLFDSSNVFSIQAVVDAGGRIVGLYAGSLEDSFAYAVELAEKIFACDVAKPYDAAICELLPPLDRNLYQSQKALENCQAGVAAGGAVVTVSECSEGVGSKYFFDQALTWDRGRNLPGDGVLRFGSHKLSRVNAIGRRVDVGLYSGLDDNTVRRVFYEPIHDIAEFIVNRAKDRKTYRVAVVRDAGHTVLRKQGNQ